MLETSTDYARPYRPLPVSILNRVGRLARKSGLGGRLSVNSLLAAARRMTGLSEFGDDWFLEPLHVLVESINEEARLTPVGTALQKARIVSALSTRLRVADFVRKNPDVLDIDLGKIILIAGLPRTATTALQRLIAANPEIRELSTWEALNPLPLRGEKQGDPRRRQTTGKLAVKTIGFLSPDFSAIHPISYDAPDEDVFLLDLSFMSQLPEAAMHVPGYSEWLERQDHTRSYEYLLTVLRLLHWQRPAKNWVLKTPNHMEHLDVILKVMPNAWIVQTHRDPKKSVASFLSLVAHTRGVFSDAVDPAEIARHWTRKLRRMIKRSMRARKSAAADVFVDVSYNDFVAGPLTEVRKIYRRAGIDFTEAAETAAQALGRRHARNRYGKHVYSLASFGLDDKTIDEYYDFYRREYRIPDENTVDR